MRLDICEYTSLKMGFFQYIGSFEVRSKMKLFLKYSVSPSHVRHSSREILGAVHWFGNLKWLCLFLTCDDARQVVPYRRQWNENITKHALWFLNCKNGHTVYSLYCTLKSKFVTGLIGAIVCLLICHIHQ